MNAAWHTHALVERSEDGVALFDMNSTNGLLLSGKRLAEKAQLKNGDRIQVARTVFEVVLGIIRASTARDEDEVEPGATLDVGTLEVLATKDGR